MQLKNDYSSRTIARLIHEMLLEASAILMNDSYITYNQSREFTPPKCDDPKFCATPTEDGVTIPSLTLEWFPMRVTYQRELKMKGLLDELGIENFVPMHYEILGNGNNRKMALVPAIHNLIFVHYEQERLSQLKMNRQGLEPLRYIMRPNANGQGQEIIRVPDRQMENFMRVASVEDERVKFLKYEDYLAQPGKRVRVTTGHFAGVEGVIKRIQSNKYVVVQIDGVAAVAIAYVPKQSLQAI